MLMYFELGLPVFKIKMSSVLKPETRKHVQLPFYSADGEN